MPASEGADGRTTDMRARILDAARARFARYGFAATSLRDIADDLEVTKAALYYHFPRKADLIHEVMLPMVDDIDAWFERAEPGTGRTRAVLEDYYDVVRQHHDLITAFGREPAALEGMDLMARVSSWIARAQIVFAGRDADLEARVRATVAIGGLARATGFVEADDPDELRRLAVQAALDALGGGGDRSDGHL